MAVANIATTAQTRELSEATARLSVRVKVWHLTFAWCSSSRLRGIHERLRIVMKMRSGRHISFERLDEMCQEWKAAYGDIELWAILYSQRFDWKDGRRIRIPPWR